MVDRKPIYETDHRHLLQSMSRSTWDCGIVKSNKTIGMFSVSLHFPNNHVKTLMIRSSFSHATEPSSRGMSYCI